MKRKKTFLLTTLIVLILIVSALILSQEKVTPKFSYRLKLDAGTANLNNQYGYFWQNETNSLNFTALANSTSLLYGDQFSNKGEIPIHGITVYIDNLPQGLLFYIPYDKNHESNSYNYPIEMFYGTLNSSESRTNSIGFNIRTSSEGKYEIPCRLVTPEISAPFNITINVVKNESI